MSSEMQILMGPSGVAVLLHDTPIMVLDKPMKIEALGENILAVTLTVCVHSISAEKISATELKKYSDQRPI